MAVEIWEMNGGRDTMLGNGRTDTATVQYMVRNALTEQEARLALFNGTPLYYENLVRHKIKTDATENDLWWIGTVEYAAPTREETKPVPNEDEGYRWSIRSAGGETIQELKSLGLVSESVASEYQEWRMSDADGNFKDLMGWEITPDGGVLAKGAPLDGGGVEIEVQWAIGAIDVSAGQLLNHARHVSRRAVNSLAWNGFPARTLRLLAFTATERNDQDNKQWDLVQTMSFEDEQTIQLTGLTNLTKAGQHHLDLLTMYKQYDHPSGDDLQLPDIIRAAVHQRRPEIDYATELKLLAPIEGSTTAMGLSPLQAFEQHKAASMAASTAAGKVFNDDPWNRRRAKIQEATT